MFYELLVDGDVANNVGNWQWIAGTRVDARPNRIFNPIKQAKRLDPDGDYVRRYVPELTEVPGPRAHEPWRAPLAARAPEYPERIVDYERVPHELDGWRSRYWRGADGETHSEELVRVAHPVVERSRAGARRLGDRYWCEVARASGGAVQCRETTCAIELRLFGFGPCLLRFGPAELDVGADTVSCRYPVRGGVLARRPGGVFTLSQAGRAQPELSASVSAFLPRLSFPPLYDRLQHRLHVRISRRYFRSLIAEGSP